MKFAFIKEQLSAFSVEICCKVLEVSRSGYYLWLRRPASARAYRRQELARKIAQVHEQNRKVYGSPRVCQALRAQGESVCENTVADISSRLRRMCWTASSRPSCRIRSGRWTSPTSRQTRAGFTWRE